MDDDDSMDAIMKSPEFDLKNFPILGKFTHLS